MIERRIHRRAEEENPRGRFATLRQVLNVIFMVGAVAGVAVYFYCSRSMGTVIILSSMVFKFVECVLRLLK